MFSCESYDELGVQAVVWVVVCKLLTVRLRSIFDEGLSPLMRRRLDGLDGVDVTGRDIRLALIVRGVE